jgi:hypothetical protein
MAWIKLDPITRRRFAKFRQIKRGYYSLLILLARYRAVDLRALSRGSRCAGRLLQGPGSISRPFNFSHGDIPAASATRWCATDLEAEYLRLKNEWRTERYFYDREQREAGNDTAKLSALDAKYPNPAITSSCR